MIEKPDFITNFKRPKNTEIKKIGNNWYLYERSWKYDPEKKRNKKVSGKFLGKITETGLVNSTQKKVSISSITHQTFNDTPEVGTSVFFMERSKDISDQLKITFPTEWKRIYVIALLRLIEPRFRRLKYLYEDSLLSHLFPNLALSPASITSFLRTIGKQRQSIMNFMRSSMPSEGAYILFDGHRLLSASDNMEFAELGYDSKMRYKPQINLLYIFTLESECCRPMYYKQFPGSTPDVTAFTNLLAETELQNGNYTIIGDKGFASSNNFDTIEELKLKYIVPLRRGNNYATNSSVNLMGKSDTLFTYHKRAIKAWKIHTDNDKDVYLFFDVRLYSDELADRTFIWEKSNNTIDYKRQLETKRRANGCGRLTDDELNQLIPKSVEEFEANNAEIGTFCIQTNRKDLSAEQVYQIYKQRQAIEEFFKEYGCTLEFDASYMRDRASYEGWLFLNHISSQIMVSSISEIYQAGQHKNISFKDLVATLRRVTATQNTDGKWNVIRIKKSVEEVLEKLGSSISNDDIEKLFSVPKD